MSKLENILVVGAGSWGSALACQAARTTDRKIELLSQDENIVSEILGNRTNSKYFGDIQLPTNIVPLYKYPDLRNKNIIIAVPSNAFSDVLYDLKVNNISNDAILIVATKGLSDNPVELLSDKIKATFSNQFAFIAGPNFAKEVVAGLLTHATLASENISLARSIASSLSSANFIVRAIDDIITIQIAGAMKNIIAIKSGIYEALGYGENAKAALITDGLKEIITLSQIMGGKLETIVEAGVVGDLVLTCYSKTSRNTKFGYELAMNQYPNNFLEHYPDLVEGVHSTKLIMELMKKYNINLPIVSSVANSIWNSPLHPLFSKEKTSTPSI